MTAEGVRLRRERVPTRSMLLDEEQQYHDGRENPDDDVVICCPAGHDAQHVTLLL